MKHKTSGQICPCGSGGTYAACCQPLHDGAVAPDAEALMRSRYSAYALGLADYIRATWHPSTRPEALDLADGPKWMGLTVLRHDRIGDDKALVEFVARFKAGGRAGGMSETSRFVRETGRWYYVDGEVA